MTDWQRYALTPTWPAPANVRAMVTTRQGGNSLPPYDGFNLGLHVGDDPAMVNAHRAALAAALPAKPVWLNQVHGIDVANLSMPLHDHVTADAAAAFAPNQVCAVMTADCLPVLFARIDGSAVAAAHAGWRGLCDGVLEAAVATLGSTTPVMAWLGPAIGPSAFEVGDEVRQAFVAHDPAANLTFAPSQNAGKWLADIYQLARLRLAAAGVTQIFGGDLCTVSDPQRFYSYRRDKTTGRMASLIWMIE